MPYFFLELLNIATVSAMRLELYRRSTSTITAINKSYEDKNFSIKMKKKKKLGRGRGFHTDNSLR